MHITFKLSLALLACSFAAGQAWTQDPATAGDIAAMRTISKQCPSLAPRIHPRQASRGDAMAIRDAHWRIRIADAVRAKAGAPGDGCAV